MSDTPRHRHGNARLREALDEACQRMEQARKVIQDGYRREGWSEKDIRQMANWGVLDTTELRTALASHPAAHDTQQARAEAAERERDASIPPLPGPKGRTYACKDSDGQWYYLNHARTWQGYQGPEAARNKGNRLDVSGLRSLPDDWDSYGAPPISESALKVAEAIHAVPMSDGGIMIEGHGGGGSLEIAINASGYVELVSWEPAALRTKAKEAGDG